MQQGALAGAAGSDDGQEFAAADADVDAPQDRDLDRALRHTQRWFAVRHRFLGRGVPRGDRQSQDVRAHAHPPSRDQVDQPEQLRCEHGLRRDDALEPRELPAVIRLVRALHEVPVDEAAGEPHADAGTGYRLVGQGLRDQVVELPVQMRNPEQGQDPGHGGRGRRDPGRWARRGHGLGFSHPAPTTGTVVSARRPA